MTSLVVPNLRPVVPFAPAPPIPPRTRDGVPRTRDGVPGGEDPTGWKLVLVTSVVLLGTTLAVLPLEWAALLLVGGIVFIVLLIRPQVALCLLAFAVPLGSIRELPVGPLSVGGAELLITLLLATWLAQMVAQRRIWVPRTPLLLPLLLLIATLILSTLPAASFELSAKEIFKWLEVVAIYWFMTAALDERWGRWVVWSLLAAGSVEALVGIYQFLGRVGPEGFSLFGRFMRAYGHFAQPNPFAGYLGLTLPIAYALTLESLHGSNLGTPPLGLRPLVLRPAFSVLHPAFLAGLAGPGRTASRSGGEGRRGEFSLRRVGQVILRVLPVASFGVMSLAMIMSWSRGGWVGLMAALLVVTVGRSRKALVVAIAVGLVVGYLLLAGGARYLPPALVQRVADWLPFIGTPYPLLGVGGVDVVSVEVNDANWAVIERMAHWQAAVAMFTDHPWLGVGIGNYPVAYPRYALGRWRDPLGHAHNYYLNIAAEAGILGLGTYLLLFGACFVVAWRTIQRTRGYWRAVALGALGVLVHLSVHNLFDNLLVHSMNVQLGLVLGLLYVGARGGPRGTQRAQLSVASAGEHAHRD